VAQGPPSIPEQKNEAFRESKFYAKVSGLASLFWFDSGWNQVEEFC
jgi:hypothetical protein